MESLLIESDEPIEANIDSPWFEWLEDGSKTREVRVNRNKWKTQALPGRTIRATNPETQRVLHLRITARYEYRDFEDCLMTELARSAPGHSFEQALQSYRGFYEAEGQPDREHGVVALTVQVIKK